MDPPGTLLCHRRRVFWESELLQGGERLANTQLDPGGRGTLRSRDGSRPRRDHLKKLHTVHISHQHHQNMVGDQLLHFVLRVGGREYGQRDLQLDSHSDGGPTFPKQQARPHHAPHRCTSVLLLRRGGSWGPGETGHLSLRRLRGQGFRTFHGVLLLGCKNHPHARPPLLPLFSSFQESQIFTIYCHKGTDRRGL